MEVSRIQSGGVKEVLLLQEKQYGRVGTLAVWPVKREKAKETITYLAKTRKMTHQSVPHQYLLNRVNLTEPIGPSYSRNPAHQMRRNRTEFNTKLL